MTTKWNFYAIDNSGKRQSFTVSASSKQAAIDKAFKKAIKNANGDITSWDCRLCPTS